jgi:ABC-type transport system involved in multi-copper enzyme maturation permease subunit
MILRTLVQKELRSILLSPKFTGVFVVSSILIILSTLIGIAEYKTSIKEYEAGRQIAEEQLNDQGGWSTMQYRAFRRPDPMQVFVSGVAFDLGRWSYVEKNRAAHLLSSAYSNDPIYAVFRFMDCSFVALIVLSLLAIVFTYDAVCGESEAGTLRLVFANPITRAQYLFAKCAGTWLGLVIPLAIPVSISLLLVRVLGIPFETTDWLRLALFLVTVTLFITFFVAFGVLISVLTKRSSVSFLLNLMCWVLFIFIIPRAAALVASRAVTVPSISEIEGKRSAYSRDQWQRYVAGLTDVFRKFFDENPGVSQERSFAFQDSIQMAVVTSIEEYEAKLLQDRRRAEATQRRFAYVLCQLSPASSFQLASMNLANTDVELKPRYEDAIDRYRAEYTKYFKDKKIDGPGSKRVNSFSDGAGGLQFSFPSAQEIDLSDLPRFVPPTWSTSVLPQFFVEVGSMLCFILITFVGSWVAFMRYDLR